MSLPIPYRLDPANLAFDDCVVFVVSALLAITVNAEGQAFAATVLGDVRSDKADRLHFNAFLHIDIWGMICFAIAGFGWPKNVDIDVDRFSHPRLYEVLSRFAGPMANLLLANIAGSVVWILGIYESEDKVFTMVSVVNMMVAVYSILPIPPLAGSSLISALFPDQEENFRKRFWQAGPFILIGIFLMERMGSFTIFSSYLDPLVAWYFKLIVGS